MTKILGVDISPNDKSLTFSKMSDIATGNLVGRAAEGTGAMETLNASTVRTLLDVPVTSHTHPSILTTSISDGDITHAPDGNSVFDALALKIDLTQKGATNGVASLDENKLVPTTQLPSYVDDVLEFNTLSVFPATGETGKIYVDIATNKTYRWSGSTYIYITSGAVDSVAGKTGVVTLAKADVGLGNVDNTSDASKPVATTSVNGIMSSTDKTKLDAITGTNTGDQINITGNAATATNATNHIADVTGDVHGATNANTSNMIVRRDASGGFSAGAIAATSITSTGNITAYFSDNRLKDFHGIIPDALSKVLSLNGYYFTENAVAKALGCCNDQMQVGVSAQEVESVLPEAVTISPIENDQNYKAVWYDKLIPLLIESIKEQQMQIEELKRR